MRGELFRKPAFFTGRVLAAVLTAAVMVATVGPVLAQTGQKTSVEGVIVKREQGAITLRGARGGDTVVSITGTTKIKERKSNPFRGAKSYAADQLAVGLNVEVRGTLTGADRVTADEIRFKDDDLRMASTVRSNVEPIENRLEGVETRLGQAEDNAQRLSGQLGEVSTVADAARAAAKAAQDSDRETRETALKSADAARDEARTANARISGLDEYDVKGTVTVLFAGGSAVISKEAAAELDSLVEMAQAHKAYVIEVLGYASSDGNAELNRRLSQRRAEAVVRHLTRKQTIPLRRIVTPFGYGEEDPVAPNDTRDGRRQNRRVEVRLLVNKVLGGPPSSMP